MFHIEGNKASAHKDSKLFLININYSKSIRFTQKYEYKKKRFISPHLMNEFIMNTSFF